MTTEQISANEYEDFRRFLEEACGIVLGDNKHYLVTSRLGRLMREFEIPNFSALMQNLRTQPRSPLRERIVDLCYRTGAALRGGDARSAAGDDAVVDRVSGIITERAASLMQRLK